MKGLKAILQMSFNLGHGTNKEQIKLGRLYQGHALFTSTHPNFDTNWSSLMKFTGKNGRVKSGIYGL